MIRKEAQLDEHAHDHMSMRSARVAVITSARSRRFSRMRAKSGMCGRSRPALAMHKHTA